MRLPRFRLSIGRMMIVVAVLAVMSWGGREFWAWKLRRGYRNPALLSRISASAGSRQNDPLISGRTVPVSVTYDLKLSNYTNPKLPPGTTCLLLGHVWFEDQETGLAVDGYTFDAPLVVGGREATSGTFTWDAMVPRPGRYLLRCFLYDATSRVEPIGFTGRGRSYRFVAGAPQGGGVDPGVKP